MRCPDCEKFTGLDSRDPEVQSLEVSGDTVLATVRIVRACSECGTELKEATLEMEGQVPDEAVMHLGENDGHELGVKEVGCDQVEVGGGRYRKSYFGAEIRYEITCSCGLEWDGTISDKVAASDMDEMV